MEKANGESKHIVVPITANCIEKKLYSSMHNLMELQFPSFPLIFEFLLFVFMFIRIKKRFKPINSTPKLPPGPRKLPLIGNMHQLADLAKIYGPLMRLKLGELSVVIVSSAENAEEVMKTHEINFAQRPYLLASRIMSYDSTNIAFSPYGMSRRCVLELLSAKRVRSFRSLREEEVSRFIESIRLKVGSPINLSQKILSLTYGISARSAFGKHCEDQEAVISAVKEAIRLGAGFSIVDLYPSVKMLEYITGTRSRLEKLQCETDRVLKNIINEHKERKRNMTSNEVDKEDDDLVDVLLKFKKMLGWRKQKTGEEREDEFLITHRPHPSKYRGR
ncbi:Cytochrome P450 [Dillenia turbinata]|uniref:Cytochrome P450 n=1 Tax=Dillenia turbinata TaxID=194707 RepID=A0AAN8W6D5_9MAGN